MTPAWPPVAKVTLSLPLLFLATLATVAVGSLPRIASTFCSPRASAVSPAHLLVVPALQQPWALCMPGLQVPFVPLALPWEPFFFLSIGQHEPCDNRHLVSLTRGYLALGLP